MFHVKLSLDLPLMFHVKHGVIIYFFGIKG